MIVHLQKTNSINTIKVVFSVQNSPFILPDRCLLKEAQQMDRQLLREIIYIKQILVCTDYFEEQSLFFNSFDFNQCDDWFLLLVF